VKTVIDSPAANTRPLMSLSEPKCSPRPQYSPECLFPIPHRLAIHFYNDMPDNRRSDPLVGEGKVNGRIAAIEFEDGPHRGTHLLALHVGDISGNTQSTEPDEGRDDCVISAGATRLLVIRHETDASSFEIISKPLSFPHGRFLLGMT